MTTTVRLLATYDGSPPQTLLDLPDALATSFVAAGNASLDLTGGVRRYQTAAAPGQAAVQTLVTETLVTANRRAVVSLPEGTMLNVESVAVSTGQAQQLGAQDQVITSTGVSPGALVSLGPFKGTQRFAISCDFGSLRVYGQNATARAAPRFSIPVPFATFGDSLADTCNATTHDLTVATVAGHQGKVMLGNRSGMNIAFYTGGKLIPVANCGVGGTTSAQILARDSAAPSATRKGAQDAANMGAKFCIISMGINNIIQNVLASTTPAAVDTLLAALYTDISTAVRRVQRLGMLPVFRQLGGYSWANSSLNYAFGQGKTAADVAAAVAVIVRASAYIKDTLMPTLGQVLLLDIRPACIDPVTGAWLPGLSTDGLHEAPNGARIIANLAAALVLPQTALSTPAQPYAPIADNNSRANAFAAPAMITVSGGFAAGFSSFATGIGSATRTGSVNLASDGTLWQDLAVTPLTFDGVAKVLAPAGLQVTHLTFNGSIFGATPAVTFAAGDPVVFEFDLVIDDGAGGVPASVLSWGVDANIGYPTGQFFTFYPVEANNLDTYLNVPNAVIAGKVISLPMAAPDSSVNMTGCFVNIKTYSGTTAPYRVRVANPRIRKATVVK